MPFRHLPPAPPILKGPARRQACRPMRRAATCWDSCCHRINLPASSQPPTEGGRRPGRVRPEGKGGAAIGFCRTGVHRHSVEPVECIACHYASLGSTKRSAEFPSFETPRVGPNSPRVDLFYPQVVFWQIQTISLSSSSIREGEREEEGSKNGAHAAHGLKTRNEDVTTGWSCHPRVFRGSFFRQKRVLARVCGWLALDPRVHGWKCVCTPRKMPAGGARG
jgi:hypothetical protein